MGDKWRNSREKAKEKESSPKSTWRRHMTTENRSMLITLPKNGYWTDTRSIWRKKSHMRENKRESFQDRGGELYTPWNRTLSLICCKKFVLEKYRERGITECISLLSLSVLKNGLPTNIYNGSWRLCQSHPQYYLSCWPLRHKVRPIFFKKAAF